MDKIKISLKPLLRFGVYLSVRIASEIEDYKLRPNEEDFIEEMDKKYPVISNIGRKT